MRFLPIHVDTQDKTILVFGGGRAAEAKLRTLVKSEAQLILKADRVTEEIGHWIEQGQVRKISKPLQDIDLSNVLLVYVATDDDQTNAGIAKWASDNGLLVNTADDKELCDFYSPAVVDRNPIVVSIGTEGTSPALARAIKADIESRLPQRLGDIAKILKELRSKVAQKLPNIAARQRFWAKLIPSGGLARFTALSGDQIETEVDQLLLAETPSGPGFVSLVGAGPGDTGLLTLAAQRKLHAADVIIYDRLVGQGVLDLGRREAEYIYVGKAPGGHSVTQQEINEIIVSSARKGHSVVRLKGGDPLIFGRADEEMSALREAGIEFDIIPGITAAAASAAEAKVSLTSRGENKAVGLMTGHDSKGFAEHDWTALAETNSRMAVYMGVGASRFIQGRLLLHGASSDKPIIVVENASRPGQKIIQTNVGNLPQDIENNRIKGPAVLLIGYKQQATDVALIDQKVAL